MTNPTFDAATRERLEGKVKDLGPRQLRLCRVSDLDAALDQIDELTQQVADLNGDLDRTESLAKRALELLNKDILGEVGDAEIFEFLASPEAQAVMGGGK